MRVLFHYTHKQTLGHTTRSVALVTALCQHQAQVLVLQGGIPQPFVHFPKTCKVKDIPLPFDDRQSFEKHAVPVSAGSRAQFILKTAADFSPDIFITEFFPFGRLAYLPELLPTLRFLRKKGTRIIASVGYPLLIDLDRLQNAKFKALHKAVFAFYDHFLIHTPAGLEDPYIQASIASKPLAETYATFMKDLKSRLVYTGYVLPEQMISGGDALPKFNDDVPTMIVSRGGGAVYPHIITYAIEAQRQFKDLRTIIACGPATTSEEMKRFQSLLIPKDKGRVFLANHLDSLDEHLKRCKVSVSLCGYNTSVQLMRYQVPSVILPYRIASTGKDHNSLQLGSSKTTTSTNDQVARAQLLQERFNSTILDYEGMTAASMAQAIREKLSSSKPSAAPKNWFNGAESSVRLIMQE